MGNGIAQFWVATSTRAWGYPLSLKMELRRTPLCPKSLGCQSGPQTRDPEGWGSQEPPTTSRSTLAGEVPRSFPSSLFAGRFEKQSPGVRNQEWTREKHGEEGEQEQTDLQPSFGLCFEENCVTPVIARFPLPDAETTKHWPLPRPPTLGPLSLLSRKLRAGSTFRNQLVRLPHFTAGDLRHRDKR